MNKLPILPSVITTLVVFNLWPHIALANHHKENEQITTTVPAGYQLEFADEFNHSVLDTSKWAYREDLKHFTAQKKENVEVKDGILHLHLEMLDKPIQQGKKTFSASGAGIISKQRFKYGYYEVRSRLGDGIDHNKNGQVDEGWHHAFWMMAASIDEKTNTVATTYPGIRRTEIDVYENPTIHKHDKHQNGFNNFTQHIIVWNEDGKEWGRLPKPPKDFTSKKQLGKHFDATNWHVYGLEWTPEKVTFYIDGKKTKSTQYPAAQFVHDELNVWLTAMGANWTGKKREPSLARYDYFRFYKKK